MKKQDLWHKSQLLLIIAFGTYPLVMVVLNRLGSGMLPWGWVFPGSYVILSLCAISVKGKWRLGAGGVMAAALAVGSFLLAPDGGRPAAVVAAVLCGALLIWSLKMAAWSAKAEIPVLWIAYGVATHLIGQVVLHADRVAGGLGLAVYSGGFLFALFGFVLLTLFSMNRNSLTAASGKRQSVPGSMRQKNGILIWAFFLISLLASLLPSAFSGMTEILAKAVAWIVSMVIRLIPDAGLREVENITNDPVSGPVGPGGEGGALVLDPAVEQFMAVCGAIITFVFLGYLLFRLFRRLAGIVRQIIGSLSKFASGVSEDYIDEVTDTREDLNREKVEKERPVSRIPFLEPRNLAPAERIRFRYQRLMRKHPEWDPGSTARENLPGNMAVLYERARYSSHPVTEEDAAVFADGSKSI